MGMITFCEPVEESDAMECNGFGRYDERSHKCDCDHNYAGDFCQMCEDPEFEYPDCTGEMEAELMESLAYEAYMDERR